MRPGDYIHFANRDRSGVAVVRDLEYPGWPTVILDDGEVTCLNERINDLRQATPWERAEYDAARGGEQS
jgi:hypothetical protein